MISLCRRAGALVVGGQACVGAIRSGNARLVIICGDASENTKKLYSQKAFYYGVPYHVLPGVSKAELSAAIGTRDSAAAVVTDEGFAERIGELIRDYEKESKREEINDSQGN